LLRRGAAPATLQGAFASWPDERVKRGTERLLLAETGHRRCFEFLWKPYRLSDLAQKMRKMDRVRIVSQN
jgi:hypothetical protein